SIEGRGCRRNRADDRWSLKGSVSMDIFTPQEVARETGSKYRGVLVAARFARYLNEFPPDAIAGFQQTEGVKKLTTLAMQKLTSGDLKFRELRRRRTEA